MSRRAAYTFPRISRLELRAFSLFTLQPNLDIEMDAGVFCLAGANGLGKSTFLAALNFGLTGFVPDPNKAFLSSDEYYQHHRYRSNYTDNYFSGRISESDRPDATISLCLQFGREEARLTRGIFHPSGLREFSYSGYQGQIATDDVDGKEIEREYQRWLTQRIGLDRFSQYAFLQHMVLTFDESRHLLLWDRLAFNEALFLAIGTDPQRASRAARLQRDMERAGSRARNIQYHASNVTHRLNTIRDEVDADTMKSGSDVETIEQEYRALQSRIDAEQEKLYRKTLDLDDVELQRARESAKLLSLEHEYSQTFELHLQGRSPVELHPVVAVTLSEDCCAVCGTRGIASAIRNRLRKEGCPLCQASPSTLAVEDSFATLARIDEHMSETKEKLSEATTKRERLSGELHVAEGAMAALNAEARQFERVNRASLLQDDSGRKDSVAQAITRLTRERDELLRQKAAKYAERDQKRKELLPLQNELIKEYAAAESDFLPLLEGLGREFLGVDLVVRMDFSTTLAALGFTLGLELRGSTRRDPFELSESQRFFLDIALRMALGQYMFTKDGEGALLIDTPEGSLDIAYESRVGKMFARFANSGQNVTMTANINTSELLLQLARGCGQERLQLQRMTSWTALSDVQVAEEHLFEAAYQAIDEALGS